MTFLSAQTNQLLTMSNITLYMFLLGNLWLYLWINAADSGPERKRKAHTVFGGLVVIAIVLAIAGVIFPSLAASTTAPPETVAAPQPFLLLNLAFAVLNGVLAVLAGAIASTITAAASEKTRTAFGFAPRTDAAPGEKPLISAWL